MPPRVSIVMATYNQDRYIYEALDSIRAQSYQDFELIIVDDGSTDTTSLILEEYSRIFPLRNIRQENQGQAAALNNGFAAATGDYLTWTSSDNNLRPTMLEVLVGELDRDPAVGLVYSDWVNIDEEGAVTHRVETMNFDRLMLMRENIVHCAFLYRRTCGQQTGPYDVHIGTKFDWDYWLRMSKLHAFKHVPHVLYEYRKHLLASHKQPHAQAQYRRFARKWSRQEPLNWYRSILLRKLRLMRQSSVSLVRQLPVDGHGLALDHMDRPYKPR